MNQNQTKQNNQFKTDKSAIKAGDVHCPTGHLLAKGSAKYIEIKCHRCKHIVQVPLVDS